jgi:hypothetical protein
MAVLAEVRVAGWAQRALAKQKRMADKLDTDEIQMA